MSFPAHQAIPQVRNSFPTPTRPWELSGPLQERVRKAPMQENSTYKKCLLLFSDLEWTSVNTYYVAEEPDTYEIEAIYCIDKKSHLKTFKYGLEKLDTESAFHRAPLTDPGQIKVVETWQKMSSTCQVKVDGKTFERVRVVPFWHGVKSTPGGMTSAAKCSSICESGPTYFGKDGLLQGKPDGVSLDAGYVGSGAYFSSSSEYAVKNYSDGHLFFTLVAMTEPYPVTDTISRIAKPAFNKYDSHYALVEHPKGLGKTVFHPSVDNPIYDEAVAFGKMVNQALARFLVKLQPRLPFSLRGYPILGDKLLEILLHYPNALQKDHDPSLQQLQSLIEAKKKVHNIASKALNTLQDQVSYLFSSVIFSKEPRLKAWLESCNASELEPGELDPALFLTHPQQSLKLLLQKLAIAHGIPLSAPFTLIKKLTDLFPEESREKDRAFLMETLAAFDLNRLKGSFGSFKEMDSRMLEKVQRLIIRPLYFFLQRKENNPSFKPSSLPEMAIEEILGASDDVSSFIPLVEEVANYIQPQDASLHQKVYRSLSSKVEFEPLREAYLRAIPKGDLYDELASIPDPSGYRISMRIEQERLRSQIEAITQEAPTSVRVKSSFFTGIRYLKPELIDNHMNSGNLKKEYPNAMHNVCRVQMGEVDVHLKEMPHSPTKEFAAYLLAALLGGGVPPSELLCFEVDGKSYPVLASETIPGTVLTGESSYSSKSLTHMGLLSLMLRRGDGKKSNHIEDETNQLFLIDNEDSFVIPITRNYGMKTVHFSSILFMLSPWYLHPQVAKEWQSLSPDLLFSCWMEGLKEREATYLGLFPESEERKRLYNKDKKNQFTPRLLLPEGTMATLFAQFHTIQQALSAMTPEETLGTELLKLMVYVGEEGGINSLGEQLYQHYQEAHTKGSTPSERLCLALDKQVEVSMTSSQSQKASLGTTPTFKEIDEEKLFSSTELENELKAYALLSASGTIVSVKDGKVCLEADFDNISPEKQRLFLKGLQHYRHKDKRPDSIALLNASSLTLELLIPFLHPGLTKLDLSRSGLTSIPSAIEQCSLKELRLSGSPELAAFEGSNYGFSRALKLPTLEVLHIANCPKLVSVQLEVNNLEKLKANNNPNLSTLKLDTGLKTEINLDESKISLKELFESEYPEFNKTLSKRFCAQLGGYLVRLLDALSDKAKQNTFGKKLLALIEQRATTKGSGFYLHDSLTDLTIRAQQTSATWYQPSSTWSKEDSGYCSDCNSGVCDSGECMGLRYRCEVVNLIKYEEAAALAKILPKVPITNLNLDKNIVEDDAMEMIALALRNSSVRRLGVGQKLELKGARALIACSQLEDVELVELVEGFEFGLTLDKEGLKKYAFMLGNSAKRRRYFARLKIQREMWLKAD